MEEGKSSISHSRSYQELGEFWDTHDLSDYWEQTEPAELDVDIRSSAIYYPIESHLAAKLSFLAGQRGVSAEALLNLWLQEKMSKETPAE